jgi:chromosome condensin MukBEF ATPase and DNA-binding subunit MukB
MLANTYMNVEDIIINLKVLEKVQIHEKLISRGQYLNIEYASVIPVGVRRWWRQDNRIEMLKKIQMVVRCAIDLIEETSSSVVLIQESGRKKKLDVKPYLMNCVQGLRNLKETYAECSATCAQLDIFIDSIESATGS